MFSQLSRRSRLLVVLYLILLFLYAIFSFGLTTPNLILINSSWFVAFQNWMWTEFFNHRYVLATVFLILILILFGVYFLLIRSLPKDKKINQKQQLALVLLLSLPLLISYNSLSHDVFNYIFNSRMVVKYQANPHLQTAIEFSHFDDWTRFMHNIHTPAPYGYGWTIISIIPYVFGVGKFLLTWLNFRVFSIVSLMLLSLSINSLSHSIFKKGLTYKKWFLLFFNPLITIEVIGNFHNDLWMMFPAVFALSLMLKAVSNNHQQKRFMPLVAWLLYAASIFIKLATLALLPLMILLTLFSFKKFINISSLQKLHVRLKQFVLSHLPIIASILMFLPLFTFRSQQFHPWYLLWPLIWLPLIKNKIYLTLLITFSFTSLMRYYPWLRENDYSLQILTAQKYITWSAIAITIVITAMATSKRKRYV